MAARRVSFAEADAADGAAAATPRVGARRAGPAPPADADARLGLDADCPDAAAEDDPGAESDASCETNAGDSTGGCLARRPSTWVLLPVPLLFMLQGMLLVTLLPVIQASWFTKCEQQTHRAPDGACKPDYEAAQAVGGVIDSVRNLFAFFSAALVGRLSDVFGRRRVLIYGLVVSTIPTLSLAMTETSSPYAYYASCILTGMLGVGSTPSFLSSITNAYIGDSYNSKDRPAQFGLLSAVLAGSMLLNPVMGKLTDKMTLQQVYITIFFLQGFAVLYILLVMPESLPTTKRNAFSVGRTLNPLAPLTLLAQSRVMRWVSLVYFLSCAAELGVKEIALIYIDEVLGLSGADAKNFNQIMFAVMGGMMLITNLFVLRLLLSLKWRATSLFVIGQFNNAIHMFVYILLGYLPFKALVFANAVPTSFVALANIAATYMISANMGSQEQGFALSTLAAVAGIADVFSPFVYSELFSYFGHHFNLPMVPFGLGIIFAFASALVTFMGPLRSIEEPAKKRILSSSHSAVYRRARANLRARVAGGASDEDLNSSLLEGDSLLDDSIILEAVAGGDDDDCHVTVDDDLLTPSSRTTGSHPSN